MIESAIERDLSGQLRATISYLIHSIVTFNHGDEWFIILLIYHLRSPIQRVDHTLWCYLNKCNKIGADILNFKENTVHVSVWFEPNRRQGWAYIRCKWWLVSRWNVWRMHASTNRQLFQLEEPWCNPGEEPKIFL